MGGEAAARQQGDHLEPRLFLGQTREAKEQGEQLRDDPVAQNDQGKERKRKVDIHGALLMVSIW